MKVQKQKAKILNWILIAVLLICGLPASFAGNANSAQAAASAKAPVPASTKNAAASPAVLSLFVHQKTAQNFGPAENHLQSDAQVKYFDFASNLNLQDSSAIQLLDSGSSLDGGSSIVVANLATQSAVAVSPIQNSQDLQNIAVARNPIVIAQKELEQGSGAANQSSQILPNTVNGAEYIQKENAVTAVQHLNSAITFDKAGWQQPETLMIWRC